MFYAILCVDVADSLALRAETRPAHIARLQALQDQGRLLLAGPHPAIDSPDPGPAGFTGSLIVAEFESLEDARALGRLRSLPRRWGLRVRHGQALQEGPPIDRGHRWGP